MLHLVDQLRLTHKRCMWSASPLVPVPPRAAVAAIAEAARLSVLFKLFAEILTCDVEASALTGVPASTLHRFASAVVLRAILLYNGEGWSDRVSFLHRWMCKGRGKR